MRCLLLVWSNSPRKPLLPPGTQQCPLTGPVGAGSTEGSPVLKMKSPLLGHCGPGTCWKVSRGWGPRKALRCCGESLRFTDSLSSCVPVSLLWFLAFQRTHQLLSKAQKGSEVGPTAPGVLEFLLGDLWGYEFLCGVYSSEERNPMLTGNSWVPLSSPCPWRPRNPSTRLRALPLSPASSLEVESWSPQSWLPAELSTDLSVELRQEGEEKTP